jgi:hypothetical protein
MQFNQKFCKTGQIIKEKYRKVTKFILGVAKRKDLL